MTNVESVLREELARIEKKYEDPRKQVARQDIYDIHAIAEALCYLEKIPQKSIPDPVDPKPKTVY